MQRHSAALQLFPTQRRAPPDVIKREEMVFVLLEQIVELGKRRRGATVAQAHRSPRDPSLHRIDLPYRLGLDGGFVPSASREPRGDAVVPQQAPAIRRFQRVERHRAFVGREAFPRPTQFGEQPRLLCHQPKRVPQCVLNACIVGRSPRGLP